MRGLSLLLVLIAACSSSGHGDFCEGACICEQQSACIGDCGNGCDLACRDVSDCDVVCDHGCTMICERVSSCVVDCGLDCEVTCRDLSSCDVVMDSGSVRCERVNSCDAGCRTRDGIVSAIEESPGLWICP
ncbi:MAG: hypothetical protein SFX73_09315 [Kofleriaceae bacterium]|nr:hypothetical protein [Kofleriaceae bacterium]